MERDDGERERERERGGGGGGGGCNELTRGVGVFYLTRIHGGWLTFVYVEYVCVCFRFL